VHWPNPALPLFARWIHLRTLRPIQRFNYLRGYLWGSRRAKFMESFDRLLWLLDRVRDELSDSERSAGMAIGHLCDLEAYLQKNESGVINYSQWREAGRRISISAVEGTVNRLIDGDLLAGFRRWFPSVGTRRIMMPWDWLPHCS
jgi:hypothetical protein